jgi:hypothetical protein
MLLDAPFCVFTPHYAVDLALTHVGRLPLLGACGQSHVGCGMCRLVREASRLLRAAPAPSVLSSHLPLAPAPAWARINSQTVAGAWVAYKALAFKTRRGCIMRQRACHTVARFRPGHGAAPHRPTALGSSPAANQGVVFRQATHCKIPRPRSPRPAPPLRLPMAMRGWQWQLKTGSDSCSCSRHDSEILSAVPALTRRQSAGDIGSRGEAAELVTKTGFQQKFRPWFPPALSREIEPRC